MTNEFTATGGVPQRIVHSAPGLAVRPASPPATESAASAEALSSSLRTTVLAFDKWAAALLLVVNFFWYRWQRDLEYHWVFRMVMSLLIGATCCMQLVWLHWAPASYFHHRPRVLLVCRIVRLAAAVSLADMATCCRTATAAAKHQPTFITVYRHRTTRAAISALPHTLAAVHLAAVISASMSTLFHSVLMPLPFLQQALLQSLYPLLLVALDIHTALAQQLQRLLPRQQLVVACQDLSYMFTAVASAQLGPLAPNARDEPACQTHAAEVLVVFVVLFVGVMAPVRVGYIVDEQQRYAQQRQRVVLRRRQQQQWSLEDAVDDELAAMATTWDSIIAYELLLLWVLALAAWVMALVGCTNLLPSTSME